MIHWRTASLFTAIAALFAGAHGLWAGPILDPTAPNTLVLYTLGSVPGIAAQYGNDISYQGIAITANTLLLAVGNAASAVQTIWSMPVIRNNGHITGLGNPTAYAQVMAAPANSFGNIMAGGLVATGGGLLYTTQGYSYIGQARNGASSVIDVAGTGAFTGGLQYVPNGVSGAGQKLIMSSITGTWYTVGLAGSLGSYTLNSATGHDVGVAAYSFDYVPVDATFLTPSIVLGDANSQRLDAYAVDSNGNPCNPDQDFSCGPVVHLVASDLGLGYGVARDPASGDILFTTQSNDIWLVSDSDQVPEPGTVGQGLGGLALVWWMRRRKVC